MTMDTAQLVRVYRKIRDARSAATALYKQQDTAYKNSLQLIANQLMAYLDANKQESARTQGEGTFWKEEQITPTAADWDIIYRWIAENNAFDFLEKRLTKSFLAAHMKRHNGAIPPGVNVLREWVIRVRKPKTAVEDNESEDENEETFQEFVD